MKWYEPNDIENEEWSTITPKTETSLFYVAKESEDHRQKQTFVKSLPSSTSSIGDMPKEQDIGQTFWKILSLQTC